MKPALAIHRPTAHDIRRIAVVAMCDPRSILRFFRGERIRPTTEARIRQALAALPLIDVGSRGSKPSNDEKQP